MKIRFSVKKLIVSRPVLKLALPLMLTLLIAGALSFGRYSFRGPVFSDPYATLIVSQSIIENHTIKLDAYSEKLSNHHAIIELGGHLYDYFPLGSSLMSLPFVYVAWLCGMDMLNLDDLGIAHVVLITIVLGILLLLIYKIGRYYVSRTVSILIASVFFFGSPISSTMATQLWSHDFTMLLNMAVIFILVRGRFKDIPPNPYLIGFMLFMSYLCRPTASLFIVAVFIYLLIIKKRDEFVKVSVTAGVLFLGLICFSYYEYGMPLPPYYHSRTWDSDVPVALFGLLFGPARGLFPFCPFLIPVFIGVAIYFRKLKDDRLFLVALAWSVSHIAIISCASEWTGGHSFGPRQLVDIMPALILITFTLWSRVGNLLGRMNRPVIVAFILTATLAVWIHSYQGLFNMWTEAWNFSPQVSPRYGMKRDYSVYVDWRFPQFMADRDMLLDMITAYFDPILGKGNYEVKVNGYDFKVQAPGYSETW